MNYAAMTVVRLRDEISQRLESRGDEGKAFSSRTRKAELIEWLTADDAHTEQMAKVRSIVRTMATEDRIWGYWRNNGGEFLTARQRRQVGRMAKRSAYRFGVSV